MIATAEVLDDPTHTTEPRLNFLADRLLSDLHADNALCILKSRIRGSSDFSKYFPITYKIPLPHLAETAQGLKTLTAVKIVLGVTDFTHGPSIDQPLVLHVENPTTKEIKSDYYLSDALGSITELVSKDGTITGHLAYSSFGNIVQSSGNALDQCYSYTSREFDREFGVYYYRARYYDPQMGRFLSEDPLDKIVTRVFDASGRLLGEEKPDYTHQESYIYVQNNPTKYVDPHGLVWVKELSGGYKVIFDPGNPNTKENPHLHIERGGKVLGKFVLPLKDVRSIPNKVRKQLKKAGLDVALGSFAKRAFFVIAFAEGLFDVASGEELEKTATEVYEKAVEAAESFIGVLP